MTIEMEPGVHTTYQSERKKEDWQAIFQQLRRIAYHLEFGVMKTDVAIHELTHVISMLVGQLDIIQNEDNYNIDDDCELSDCEKIERGQM